VIKRKTGAERGKLYRPIQHQLAERGAADVLEWLKSQYAAATKAD
jgi:hypothetical protein